MDFIEGSLHFGIPLAGAFIGFMGGYYKFKHDVATLKESHIELKGEASKKHTELKDLIERLDEELDEFKKATNASSADFASDKELADFMSEVNNKWQEIQRTLGRIEGLMEASNTKPPPHRPSNPRQFRGQ